MSITKDPPEYVAKPGEGARYVVIFYDPQNPKAGFDVRIFSEDIANPSEEGEKLVARFKESHPRQGMEVAAWEYTSWFENIEENAYEMGLRELKKKIFGKNIRRHYKGSCDVDDLFTELSAHQALIFSIDNRKRLKESTLLKEIKSQIALMKKE